MDYTFCGNFVSLVLLGKWRYRRQVLYSIKFWHKWSSKLFELLYFNPLNSNFFYRTNRAPNKITSLETIYEEKKNFKNKISQTYLCQNYPHNYTHALYICLHIAKRCLFAAYTGGTQCRRIEHYRNPTQVSQQYSCGRLYCSNYDEEWHLPSAWHRKINFLIYILY